MSGEEQNLFEQGHTGELFTSPAWQAWTREESTASTPPIDPAASHTESQQPTGEPKPNPRPGRDPRFRAAVTRTIGSTILPGIGLLGTKLHTVGVILVTILVMITGVVAFIFLRNPLSAAGSALQVDTLYTIGIGLAVLAVLWVTVITVTYLVSKPRVITAAKRAIGAVLVWVLSTVVSVPLGIASSYAIHTAQLTGRLFSSETSLRSQTRPTLAKVDPWEGIDRVNILLLGADSGLGRDEDELGIRTDSLMVASIDTQTGDTVLIQIPRNLEHAVFASDSPLAEYYPYGYQDDYDSMISSIWNEVPATYPEVFEGKSDHPGADALKWAVEGVTGLNMDYYVLVNMDGLRTLIDAMGGVTVNVNFPIAKGGSVTEGNCGFEGFIPEGPNQHLTGDDALWYGRSRCNDVNYDYGRMRRQSCLVSAIIDQADPKRMALHYESIADAAASMISTDIPMEHLSAIVELADRVKQASNVLRIRFQDQVQGFYSAYPDFILMQSQIQQAIAESAARGEAQRAAATATPEPTAQTETAASDAAVETSVDEATETVEQDGIQAPIETVDDACAYRHEPFDSSSGYYPPAEAILEPATTEEQPS